MPFDSSKPWWQSKTVWGGLIALAAAIAGAFGYVVDPDVQAELVDYVLAVATGVGGVLAIIGRLKAKDRIK